MQTFSDYQHLRIFDAQGNIANGDYVKEEVIIRTDNGYLNDVIDPDGNYLPAIEFLDGSHYEHWKNGVLHYENAPAVVDIVDKREEWWFNGKKLNNPIIKKEIM